MKRTAFILTAALASAAAAPVLAGETFTLFHETTVQQHKIKHMGSDRRDADMILGKGRTFGDGNQAEITQIGDNHSASLHQTGNNSSMRIFQQGDGAVANVVQSGDNKVGFLLQLSR